MLRCFYPWADGIVAVSNGVADDYVHTTGIQSNRISIIYNPVITPALYKKAHEPFEHPWLTPKEPPVILSVGRLTEQKDYSTLIRAFAKVREKRPARLLILGEGELRKDLESLMRKLHLENDMALPGFVKNPYQYMAKASVFALSSKWEGLPTVLIEALAIGIPVVSTNCKSGPDEILRNGRLGKLVPVGEVMALADAISESLSKSKPNIRCETLEQFERSWAIEEYLKILKGESCE
jgi:glycosyltransferase involved in cell wall biosynthesis